jgi:hypothetical protein
VTILYVATNAGYLRALTFDEIRHAPEDRVGTAAARRSSARRAPSRWRRRSWSRPSAA